MARTQYLLKMCLENIKTAGYNETSAAYNSKSTVPLIYYDLFFLGCQVNVEKDQGVHQVGVLLTYPDCSQSEIHFTVQLEGAPNLPETEAEAISWKNVHLTMDQWKKIQEELGLEKSVKSANVSLDNLVTGKRRSKPVTPVKSLTKKRVKKGGEHVETSAQSESDLNGQFENTSDEEINNQTTPKRTRLPRKPILKNLVFLLTQGKPKHTGNFLEEFKLL